MNRPAPQQTVPGTEREMDPKPGYREESHRGSDRLAGADSRVGTAVALVYTREGPKSRSATSDGHA